MPLPRPSLPTHALPRLLLAALLLCAALDAGAAARRRKAQPDSLSIELAEVTIRPKKEKYSKKNNPAVALMQRLRAQADSLNPRRRPFYGYDKYERTTLAMNNFSGLKSNGDTAALLRAFPVLREYLDTSVVTGAPILNIALREKSSHVFTRSSPQAEKELVTGLRHDGFDDMLDPQAMRTFYEDVLREIDVVGSPGGDVTLLQNRFVSPLGRLAPDFYRFYLQDTTVVDGDTCIVLSFVPRNNASFGFTGKMYVGMADTASMFVRRLEMGVPKNINLNFVDNVLITQEFVPAPDGSSLKTLDDMVVEAQLVPGSPRLYARRVTAYRGHTFRPPIDMGVFDAGGAEIVSREAYERDPRYWDSRRYVAISGAEDRVGDMMDRLRSARLFYWGEKVLSVLVNGYITTGNPSRWNIGPVNTAISGNPLEGVRLKVGGMSTAALSKRWFTRDYVAWGTRDHRWKYMAEVEYSFADKERHSREFPVNALRAMHRYDVDMLGQHYLFTNPDNVFLTLKRSSDIMMTYKRETSLKYIREWRSNFSLELALAHERQEASRFINFWDGNGRFFTHYGLATAKLTLRYAPGEKFFQTASQRIPVNLDAPVFQLSHTWGPRGALGNRWAVSVTEALVQKRWWLSAFGYVDMILRGGHVWSSSPFTSLLIPNANLSYTIQPESFALLDALEFINDSYASWDLTYWLNGALLNLIPVVKQARLREVVAFRGIWGRLSDHNNPLVHPDLPRFPLNAVTHPMTDTPYMELSVGLENILRVLRVDYVWRLTYRDTPHAPNSGLRVSLHITF